MTVTPFTFTKATKTKRKARIALVGYEGTGKTYTALSIASRIAERVGKRVALADSEGGSASIYADLFDFDNAVLPDASPATYRAIIRAAAQTHGVLVLDSLSHEWIGASGALEMKDKLSSSESDGFRAWAKVTPEHRKVFEGIIAAPIHIIATMRQKKAYVIEQNERGKNAPRLIGTEPVQREGMEYEFDLILTLDQSNTATVTKSRFHTIVGGTRFEKPGIELADLILDVLDEGEESTATMSTSLATDDLNTIITLGKNSSDQQKAAFFDVWLTENGFAEETREERWKHFARQGGPLAFAAIEWWRNALAPTQARDANSTGYKSEALAAAKSQAS